MILDEAIRHCEEVAKEKEQMAFDLVTTFNRETINSKECKKCANEHRQLAEWLKEYKRLKERSSMSSDEIDALLSAIPIRAEDRFSLKRILEEDPSLKKEIEWDDIAGDENIEWVRTIKAWTPAKVPKQEPCEDYISRAYIEPVVEELENICYNAPQEVLELLAKIKNAPPVNPQSKMGHWIIIDDCELFMAKCSKCGEIVDSRMINKYPYCHCGAKMAKSQDSEG